MPDPLDPIDRVIPSPPLPKVTRQRTREDEQHGGSRQPPPDEDEDPPDDGLLHVDVRA